jgi:hypothetical protein
VDLVASSGVREEKFLSVWLDYWTSDQDMNIIGVLTETGSFWWALSSLTPDGGNRSSFEHVLSDKA